MRRDGSHAQAEPPLMSQAEVAHPHEKKAWIALNMTSRPGGGCLLALTAYQKELPQINLRLVRLWSRTAVLSEQHADRRSGPQADRRRSHRRSRAEAAPRLLRTFCEGLSRARLPLPAARERVPPRCVTSSPRTCRWWVTSARQAAHDQIDATRTAPGARRHERETVGEAGFPVPEEHMHMRQVVAAQR